MSLKKKISIKSIHMMGGSTPKKEKKRKKREKKALSSIFKPNKIKNELLEKIKRHQQKKKQVSQTPEKDDDSFADSFQNSLLYLDKVSEKQKKKKKKRTMKKGILKPSKYGNYQIPEEVSREISQEIINQNAYTPPPDPPYGILKNGNKELYSSYRKRTIKNNHHSPIKISTPEREIPKPLFISERQDKLKTLKDSINPDPIPKKYKKMRTLKKKLRLGKYNNKVSVLIKNRRTRKKIKNETLKLKKKSLEEIKQYLRLHNLIKIGTNAPEDLLRETFENAFLSGNIYNKSTENLLHNYINKELT